ncbi:hypothetical protein [Peterkaempfera griseoplana]|uniref:hypothetical protein n=1 Tax=Peterkaempfera griseoplana TaxID=66896 RepID=UPI0006E27353|nr:hypothetical protein [Peterkaempfera griseoplana]
MTDTPGWTPPGAPEPQHEEGATPGLGAAPGPSAPQDGPHGVGAPPPPPGQPGWGGPHPYKPYPGGPYGGQPGAPAWGGPGWGVPLAPKPGVIPLRPLGVGEILDGAVSTTRRYWRTTLGISVVVALLSTVTTTLIDWGVSSGTLNRTATAVGDLLNYLVLIVAGQVAGALLTMVVSRAVLGRPVSLREAWRDARPRLLPLLGLVLVMVLAVVLIAGVLLLPGILAAVGGADTAVTASALLLGALAACGCLVWLWIRYSMAAATLMLEKQGIRSSLARSARLVRGSWWRIFGITLLGGLVTTIFSSIFVFPATLIGLAVSGQGLLDQADSGPTLTTLVFTGIGSAIASTLTVPVTAGINILLYVDQRIRREALDIELARAAGLPGFGDTTAEAPAAGPEA